MSPKIQNFREECCRFGRLETAKFGDFCHVLRIIPCFLGIPFLKFLSKKTKILLKQLLKYYNFNTCFFVGYVLPFLISSIVINLTFTLSKT